MWELFCYAYVFAAEGITALTYFQHIFNRKSKVPVLAASFIFVYVILFAISQLESLIFNCAAYVLANCFLLFLNFECKKISGLLQVSYMTFIMCTSEILTALCLSVISHDFAAYSYSLPVMAAFAVLSRLLFFFIVQISARCIKPTHQANKDSSAIILLTALPVSSVWIALTIIYIGMTVPVHTVVGMLMTVSVMLLLLLNILVMIVYNHIQKMAQEQLTLQLRMQKEQADTDYYKMLQQQYDNQRILIHDIKQHLQTIQSLANNQKSNEIYTYIENLEHSPGLRNKIRLCDHSILNMVLIQYTEICTSKKIDFHCDIREGSVDLLDATSITALFGNLLANAVEAAEQSEEKWIDLSVQKMPEHQLVMISLINACDQSPVIDASGHLISQKDNQSLHGIGSKSIERVIKKHHGSSKFYFDAVEKQFHYIIQFPIPV